MTPTASRKPDTPPAAPGDSPGDWVRDWNRFWFNPADPTTLAFMRLCCGALVLYIHLSYSWGLLSYVGPDGWVDAKTSDEIHLKSENFAPPWDWGPQNIQLPDPGRFTWSIFYHV